MSYVKQDDIVLIDSINFENFMDYREKRGLKDTWGWMHLPAGTMMEVKDLIFRTTGRRRKKKTTDENDVETTKYSGGRSCWVKCSIVTPLNLTGEIHTIPSWVLKKRIVSKISAKEKNDDE